MQARNVTARTLQAAADEIGVTLDITTQNARGTRHRVKLNPRVPDSCYRPPCKKHRTGQWPEARCRCRRWNDERGDAPYQRANASSFRSGQRVHAVCWHGFRDFFRAVYRREPGAIFVTAYDTWRGSDDFEARFRESGHRNIGSQMYPVAAAEACRCPEAGFVGQNEGSALAGVQFNTFTNPVDTYGADEADGAACRAMANALRAAGR